MKVKSLGEGFWGCDRSGSIRERESGDRRLYAVSFDDCDGNRWFWLVAAERGETGWVAQGVAGGSEGPAHPQPETPRAADAGSGPRLNLCGQWGGDRLYAGGSLDPAGTKIGCRACHGVPRSPGDKAAGVPSAECSVDGRGWRLLPGSRSWRRAVAEEPGRRRGPGRSACRWSRGARGRPMACALRVATPRMQAARGALDGCPPGCGEHSVSRVSLRG